MDTYKIKCGRCEDYLPIKADAYVTDPPYAVSKAAWENDFHGSNGKSPLWGEKPQWDELQPIVLELPKMAKKVVIFGGNYYALPPSKCWFVWDKLQNNRGADGEYAWVQADLNPKIFRMSRIDAYVNKADCKKRILPKNHCL